MILVAPLASSGNWVNDPEPGGTTIEVAQGENFVIRHTLEWSEPEDGAYTVTISWVNYENKPSENFTFLEASAYFTTGSYVGQSIQADVVLGSSPEGENTKWALSVNCPADDKDSRNGQFNVDITLGAYGVGGVPHIRRENHPILYQFGGIIIIESSLQVWNRAPITIRVGGRGVEVLIEPESQSGLIGENVVFTVTVKNTGDVDDNYDLTVSDNAGWGPTLSQDSLVVPKNENRKITLTVTVPENAPVYTKDKITVTATSQADLNVSDNDSCIAHSIGRGVVVSIEPSEDEARPGENLIYTLTVRNTRDVSDTFDLTVSDNAIPSWGPTLSEDSLTIAAGASDTATLTVTIPGNAIGCTNDKITVTATSTENAEVTDNDSCIAHATIVRRVEVSIEPSYQENENGGTLTYTVTVANTGNVPDTYKLENTDTEGWTLSLENNSLEVPESGNRTTTLTVTIPVDAAGGTDDTVTITATSTENMVVSGSGSCIAHAVVVGGLQEVKLYPIDDSFVWQGAYGGKSHGTLDYLRVGYQALSQRGFLKFKLENIPAGATIEKVELYLRTRDNVGGGENVRCHRVDNDDWDEDTITWNNQASVGGFLDNRNCSENDKWYSWYVTDFVASQWENENDRVASFCMVGVGENIQKPHYAEFHTKESITGGVPFLKVIYSPSPNSFFVSISPSYQSGLRGRTLNYTVMVKNAGLENSTYNLENRDDAGWSMTLDKVQFENVPPGENRTATLTVTIPDNASPGMRDNVTVIATVMENENIRGDASCVAHSTIPALGVSITPEYQSGVPGQMLTYKVMVKNVGLENDSYSLHAIDNEDWNPTLDNNLFENVPPDENRTTNLMVTIPDDAVLCTKDNITVIATSLVDNTVENSALCIAHSGFAAVGVSITPENQSGLPGATLTYTVTITNKGNVEDTYDLSVSDNAGWGPTLSENLLMVPIGENKQTKLNVMVPANAPICTRDNIIITTTSRADSTVENSAKCVAHSGFLDFEVSIKPDNQSGEADYNILDAFDIEYTVTVVNKGTITDNYILTVSDNAGWGLLLSNNTLKIPGGENKKTTLYVEIPSEGVPLSSSGITVTATSQTNNTVRNASCVARVAVVDFEITLAPSYQRGLPGEDLFYVLTVTNTGTGAEPKIHIWSLSDTENWISPENASIPVLAGESANVYLTIRVLDNATHCTKDNLTAKVRVYSHHTHAWITKETNTIAHATTLKLEVIVLLAPPKLKKGKPGNDVFFPVVVRNLGLENDTYDLTVVDDALPSWNWRFDDNPLENVQAENSGTTKLWVTIPNNVPPGTKDNLMVIATSRKDPTISASDNCIVLVENFTAGVNVSISPSYQEGPAGTSLAYTVRVTNTGDVPDTYELTTGDDAGWSPTVSPSSIDLSPGASGNATLTVGIPETAEICTRDNIWVIARSLIDDTVEDSASCTAHAIESRGVEVYISPSRDTAEPGKTLTFTVTVRNTGSVPDNYNLTVSDDAGWGATLAQNLLTVPAGVNRTTTVSVKVPSDAVENESTEITVAATSQAAPTVSDSASCIATAKSPVTNGIPLLPLAISVFLIGAAIIVPTYLLRVRPKRAVKPWLLRDWGRPGAAIPGMGRKKAARRRVLRDASYSV